MVDLIKDKLQFNPFYALLAALGFCPSCHAKRLEEWGEWMRETLLQPVLSYDCGKIKALRPGRAADFTS
jgi:hypothetical protein